MTRIFNVLGILHCVWPERGHTNIGDTMSWALAVGKTPDRVVALLLHTSQ